MTHTRQLRNLEYELLRVDMFDLICKCIVLAILHNQKIIEKKKLLYFFLKQRYLLKSHTTYYIYGTFKTH